MRRTPLLLFRQTVRCRQLNLVHIHKGTFYREHPSVDHGATTGTSNPPLFPNLTFELSATDNTRQERKHEHWAVIAATDGTTFLEVLRGSHLCFPPSARSYPYLASKHIDDKKDHRLRIPSRAIQYVGFNTKQGGQISGGGVRGAYLSARYESRREETDWTVLQYLKGDTELNPGERDPESAVSAELLDNVISDLRLQKLVNMPVSNLSNGQTRRSRIAKALLGRPLLLLLDEPFMGLDPPTLVTLSPMLKRLAYKSSPLLMLGLRPQDPIPDWITNLVVLGHNHTVALMGTKDDVLQDVRRWVDVVSRSPTSTKDRDVIEEIIARYGFPPAGVTGDVLSERGITSPLDSGFVKTAETASESQNGLPSLLSRISNTSPRPKPSLPPIPPSSHQPVSSKTSPAPSTTPLIELSNVNVKYGPKTVLGHKPFSLSIHPATRLALLGPNGSGKTTLLSLLTSDHPQSYSLPIKFFGRSRLPDTSTSPPTRGLSLWEIQSRIGHSSPEIHAFFPKHLSVRRALESAWAETFAGKPALTPSRSKTVDRVLRWWEPELRQDSTPPYTAHPSANSSRDPESDDLSWSTNKDAHPFAHLPFSAQRLLLLLRALIKSPSIIILDEAFSGLSANTRDKAMSWLEFGETDTTFSPISPRFPYTGRGDKDEKFSGLTPEQALIVVSHIPSEIPDMVDSYVRLPGEEEVLESGRGVEQGWGCERGWIKGREGWGRVWGV